MTPVSRMKYPQLPIHKAICKGYNPIYNDRTGPPWKNMIPLVWVRRMFLLFPLWFYGK